MPVTLYPRQKQIFSFIVQYIEKFGFSPTLQEIADAIEVSSLATVHEHLEALEKKGVIKRYRGAVRGIKVKKRQLDKLTQKVELPLLGLIAAGKPLEPYPDEGATLQVSPTMLSGKKRAYALQVKGNSMVEEGILDGDYIIVEEQETANNGDIVVALLKNGLATLKRFFQEKTRVRLEPANAQMAPIYTREIKIQGRVVGVVRRFR